MGLKEYFAQNEQKSIMLILITYFCCYILFLLILFNTTDTYDTINLKYSNYNNEYMLVSYEAEITQKNAYTVLYNNFVEDIALYRNDNQLNNNLIVKSVSCEKGTPYVSLRSKNIYVFSKNTNSFISTKSNSAYSPPTSKIQPTELGCYYDLEIKQNNVLKYELLVNKEHIEKNNFKHYLFSDTHFLIKKLNIEPLNSKPSTKYFIPDNLDTIINVNTGSVKYSNNDLLNFSFQIFKFILVLFPLFIITLVYITWKKYGCDKLKEIVPSIINRIPNPKKNYLSVHMIINGIFNNNGFSAIFLNLINQNIIEVYEKKETLFSKEVSFKIKKNIFNNLPDFQLNELEKEIILTLKKDLSKEKTNKNDFFETKQVFKKIDETNDSFIFTMNKRCQNNSFIEKIKKITEKRHKYFIDLNGFQLVFIIMIFGHLFFGFLLFKFFKPDVVFPAQFISTIIFIILLVLYKLILKIQVSTLFSKFKKEEYYKEYLEWISFRRYLKELANTNKYDENANIIWKNWLLYATALGVGKEVLKYFHDIKLISQKEYNTFLVTSSFTSRSYNSAYHSSNSGGGAGGVGGGGGFGGGGGGGR